MSRTDRSGRTTSGRRGAPPEETGVTWERRRARLVLPVLLVVAVLSAVVLGFVSPIRQLLAQQRRIERTSEEADALDAKNVRLNDRIEQLQRDSVIEQIAREELGLVMPGEEAYVIVPGAPATAAPPEPGSTLPVPPTTTAVASTPPQDQAPPTKPEPGMSKYADLDPGPG